MKFVTFTLVLIGCAGENEPVKFETPYSTTAGGDVTVIDTSTIPKIAIIGDSTAVRWPVYLQPLRTDWYVINHAVGGSGTSQITSLWTYNTRPTDMTAVIVLGGVVDLLFSQSRTDAFNRLAAIYLEAKNLGMQVYAVTVFPTANVPSQSELLALNDQIRGAANVTAVIDLYDSFAAHPEWYDPDGLHHNSTGWVQIANAIAAELP